MGDILKPTLSLFIICTVIAAALAFTYAGTKDIIAERQKIDAENARREVLAAADSFKPIGDIAAIIGRNPGSGMVKEAYEGLIGGSPAGYVFTVAGKGYGGDVNVIVGIDASNTITGVKIGGNSETPGLGSKAKDAPFISQFVGLKPEKALTVVKGGGGTAPEEINAISGATITSRAVTSAVQAAVDTAAELEKGEVGD